MLGFLITDLLLKWVVVSDILFHFQIERHCHLCSPVPMLRHRVLFQAHWLGAGQRVQHRCPDWAP